MADDVCKHSQLSSFNKVQNQKSITPNRQGNETYVPSPTEPSSKTYSESALDIIPTDTPVHSHGRSGLDYSPLFQFILWTTGKNDLRTQILRISTTSIHARTPTRKMSKSLPMAFGALGE